MARGPRRRRRVLVRNVSAAGGHLRHQGGDQRGLGGELRPGRRPERRQHLVHRPGRTSHGHLHLRLCVPPPLDRRRDRPRRPRCARRRVAFRPRTQGLPGDRPQLDLEGLVHDRQRGAQRRLLPDRRQHQRRDHAVPGQRRVHLHRPPVTRHDLQRHGDQQHRRHGLQGHVDGEERQVHDPDGLHHRPGEEHGPDAGAVCAETQPHGSPAPALRALRPDHQRERRWRPRQRRRRFRDGRYHDRASDHRRLGSGHGYERRQPRLCATGGRRARRSVHLRIGRLRRQPERRPHRARRIPRPVTHLPRCERGQRRRDRAGRPRRLRDGTHVARVRRDESGGGRGGGRLALGRVRRCVRDVQGRLERLRRHPRQPAHREAARHRPPAAPAAQATPTT